MEQEKNTLTVLEIAPGHYPKQVEIDPDLKALQQAVGGNIGASYPFSDPVAIVYNDEGKLMGLPLNRACGTEAAKPMMWLPEPFWWSVWVRKILHLSPRSWRRSTRSIFISRKILSSWGIG